MIKSVFSLLLSYILPHCACYRTVLSHVVTYSSFDSEVCAATRTRLLRVPRSPRVKPKTYAIVVGLLRPPVAGVATGQVISQQGGGELAAPSSLGAGLGAGHRAGTQLERPHGTMKAYNRY